jgi:hypothetical protein
MCFEIAKANIEKKQESFLPQKTFTVIGMNVQKNYEVTFKFFPQKKFIHGPAPKAIELQNKLMTGNSPVILTESSLKNLNYFRKNQLLKAS